MQELAALRVRVHAVQTALLGSSQILVHNEGKRHLQLAKQLVRTARSIVPVDGLAALFFREDLTEPPLELVDLHGPNVHGRFGCVPNLC